MLFRSPTVKDTDGNQLLVDPYTGNLEVQEQEQQPSTELLALPEPTHEGRNLEGMSPVEQFNSDDTGLHAGQGRVDQNTIQNEINNSCRAGQDDHKDGLIDHNNDQAGQGGHTDGPNDHNGGQAGQGQHQGMSDKDIDL